MISAHEILAGIDMEDIESDLYTCVRAHTHTHKHTHIHTHACNHACMHATIQAFITFGI